MNSIINNYNTLKDFQRYIHDTNLSKYEFEKTEEYKKEEAQTENYHIMVTTFEVQNEEMIIIQKLYFVKTVGQQDLKKTKTVTFISSNNNLKIKEVIV